MDTDLTTSPLDRQLKSAIIATSLLFLSLSTSTLCVAGRGFALLTVIGASLLSLLVLLLSVWQVEALLYWQQ